MERVLKWSLPLLVVVNVALVWSGVLEAGTALLVGVAVELLLAAVALRQLAVAVRHYRRDRAAGLDIESALEDGLAVILPRPVARLVAIEPRMWLYLYRWLFRRRPLGKNEFGYSKRSALGTLLVLVLVSTPVELFIVELLVPWAWLRWLLLIAAIYGALWLLAFYASLKVLPHRLEAEGLRVHYGIMASGLVPYETIAAVELQRRKSPEASEGLRVVPEEGSAYIAVGGRTDVTLRLTSGVELHGLLKATPPVTTIHLAADDPAGLVDGIRLRVAGIPGTDQVEVAEEDNRVASTSGIILKADQI